jgi:hypothetical protein
VLSLDVAGKVVVDEVLAAELTGVVQNHHLSLPLELLVVGLVLLELGSDNTLATLTDNSRQLELSFLGLFLLNIAENFRVPDQTFMRAELIEDLFLLGGTLRFHVRNFCFFDDLT